MRVLKFWFTALFLAALALGPAVPASAATSQAGGFFDLDFYDQGEYNSDTGDTSLRPFTENEKKAMIAAAKYWAGVLNLMNPATQAPISVITMADENASGGAKQPYPDGSHLLLPLQYFLTQGGLPAGYADDHLGNISIGNLPFTYGDNGQQSPRPWSLESVMVHELGHVLGLAATDRYTYDGDGMPVGLDLSAGTASDTWFGTLVQNIGGNTFSNGWGDDQWVFTGAAAMDVYGDVWTGNAAREVEMDNSSTQARSHFGLRNGLMTHRLFRNYAYFMEAEMAALNGIGYIIDLRDRFGRSIYTDNNSGVNAITYSDGFFQSGGIASPYTALPNTAPYALGLHIYGSGNEVTVDSKDIRADGVGAAGLRVDGWNNKLVIDNVKVTANGARGTGLLVAYGRGQELELINGGSITAAGDAVRFDIGVNLMEQGSINADGYGALALYSYFKLDCSNPGDSPIAGLCGSTAKPEFEGHTAALAGALADTFNVAGTITGGRSAIYISPNSHVREINILDGAVINGAIISDYDDQWGAAAAAGQARNTALNISAADFTVDGAILGYGARPGLNDRFYLGRGLIDLTMKNGNTTRFTPSSLVKVNSFAVEGGAELLVKPSLDGYTVISANNFNLQPGSLVGFYDRPVNLARPETLYRLNPTLRLELLNGGGAFANQSQVDPDALQGLTIDGTAYTGYGLDWYGGRTLVLDLSGLAGLDFAAGDKEQFGGYAVGSATALAYNDVGWRLIQRRTRLESDRRNPYNQLMAPPPAGEENPYNHAWAEVFYGYARQKSGELRDGYKQRTPGVALGYDNYFTETALAGLALALGLPDYEGDFVENDGQIVTLAAYSIFQNPQFLDLDLAAGYSWNSYDQTRRSWGETYQAKYHGHTWRLGAGLSRTLDLGEGFRLTPRAGYEFIQLETNDYTEGAGPGWAPLVVGSVRQNLHRASLGAELDWQSEAGLGLVLRGGWGHLAGDLEGRATTYVQGRPGNRLYTAVGDKLDRNVAEAGLGLDVPLGDDWSLNLDYDGAFSRNVQAHSGELKFNLRF
ncbi:MAG: autotransporter domain-containing protein [Candidatus Adiutrix sp.]|jgi:outer membrane autotransporter protein|nr:autotransporter domain-containing protein [Candidatus Adiutrix sp.]